jgi:mannose-binding lectin 2
VLVQFGISAVCTAGILLTFIARQVPCGVVVNMKLILSLVFVLLLVSGVCGEYLQFHSFQPPFNQVDASGTRIINENWRSSGTAVVNSNFIRLTPDRQSKKGALWSRKPVGVPNFSTVMKFRISGQGRQFYGDGIGLWIVQQGYHISGSVHGFMENFYGVGIIFDTFKNTENLQSHRDVTILVNDGTKTYEMMTKDVQGCDAAFRYHNERADFSVLDASRAKVVIDDKK